MNKMMLRTGRNKVTIFDLETLHIKEVTIDITFRHQKLVDLIEVGDTIYAMTEKDVRHYNIK
jgi:predicted nicotinamide N-methyase